MSEIEVGEYVRTEEGYIGILIEYIPNALNYLKIDVGKEIRRDNGMSDNYIYTRYGFQLKHSKQPIDLIEVKDVIKYRINNISTTLETKGYVEGIVDISNEEMLQRIKNDKNYEVLEILTHQQYMANCYKVGGEQWD
jgi:hypothetical protein|nr:MAG TPA: hypothetical protein [Caudoviricetes sp.]